jgi:hypothetical protein
MFTSITQAAASAQGLFLRTRNALPQAGSVADPVRASCLRRLCAFTLTALVWSGVSAQPLADTLSSRATQVAREAASPSAAPVVSDDQACLSCPCPDAAQPQALSPTVPSPSACDGVQHVTKPDTSCPSPIDVGLPLPLPARIAFCRWLH